jgi:hypothetical protein
MLANNIDNMIRATYDPSMVILPNEKHKLSPKVHVIVLLAVVATKAIKANPSYFYN